MLHDPDFHSKLRHFEIHMTNTKSGGRIVAGHISYYSVTMLWMKVIKNYKLRDALLMLCLLGWPCKLLLMCRWLEFFNERDWLGHRGVGLDLWLCVCGLKTPIPLGAVCLYECAHVCTLCVFVFVCVCVCWTVPIHQGNITTATTQSQRLLSSFTGSWKKNGAGKSINQESTCHKRLFSPFDGPRSLSSCTFNFTFFHSSAPQLLREITLVGSITLSITLFFSSFSPTLGAFRA